MKIQSIESNVGEPIPYSVNDNGKAMNIAYNNEEVLYGDEIMDAEGRIITPPAENITKDVVIDLSTIHLYTDILRAKGILNIKQRDILNLENKVFIEPTDNPNSDIIERLKLMLNNDLDYVLGSRSTDFQSDEFRDDITSMNSCKYLIYFISPIANNIRSIYQAVQNSHKYPGRVILCLVRNDNGELFNNEDTILNEYYQVGQTIVVNGGKFFMKLEDLANFINNN